LYKRKLWARNWGFSWCSFPFGANVGPQNMPLSFFPCHFRSCNNASPPFKNIQRR
jgi:hypothetical protein